MVLVQHEPWCVPLLSVDDGAVLYAKSLAHEADAEPSWLVTQYSFYSRNLGPMTGSCSAVDYREEFDDPLLPVTVAFNLKPTYGQPRVKGR